MARCVVAIDTLDPYSFVCLFSFVMLAVHLRLLHLRNAVACAAWSRTTALCSKLV